MSNEDETFAWPKHNVPMSESQRHVVTLPWPAGGQAPLQCWCDRDHTLQEAMQLNGDVEELTIPTSIAIVTYEWEALQSRAELDLPLGWCNGCIAKAKNAEENAEPAEPINAAVTTIAQVQSLTVPSPMGPQTVTTVIALPSCIYCIGIAKPPPRIQAANGPIGGIN